VEPDTSRAIDNGSTEVPIAIKGRNQLAEIAFRMVGSWQIFERRTNRLQPARTRRT
jgi:hypothetical protein